MGTTAYFDEAVEAMRPLTVDMWVDGDTDAGGWWPVDSELPLTPAMGDGRVHLEFTGHTDEIDGRPHSKYWLADDGADAASHSRD